MLIWISSLQEWKDPQLHEWYIAGIIQWNSWEQCLINLVRGLSRVNDGLHNPLIRPAISLEGGPLSTTARHDNKNCPPPKKKKNLERNKRFSKSQRSEDTNLKKHIQKNIPNTYHIYIYIYLCLYPCGNIWYELLRITLWNLLEQHPTSLKGILRDLFQIICQLHEKNTNLNFCCTWVISARCSTWRSSWGTKTNLLSTYRINHWFPLITP